MRKFTLSALSALVMTITTPVAFAQDLEAAARTYLNDTVAAWASDPLLIEAIRQQNTETAGLSEDEILAMDIAWRAETSSADTPTIDGVITNAASEFLRSRIDEAGGVISEAFVMDAVGLNVASSGVTSDYWQGDEAKFTETYPNGAGTVHLGELELDESTQLFQIQVSQSIVDPSSNETIGVITIGLNAEAL